MPPSSTITRLAAGAIAVLLLVLPAGTLAQPTSNRRPVAHVAKARNAHKHVRCHTRSRKHGRRRCVKAHKTSHKRAHASRAHRPSAPAPKTPAPAPSAPSDPAGPVQAPVLTITGTTYYVSASGSDSNSGTSPGSAWRTVQHVDRASLHVFDDADHSFHVPARSGRRDADVRREMLDALAAWILTVAA